MKRIVVGYFRLSFLFAMLIASCLAITDHFPTTLPAAHAGTLTVGEGHAFYTDNLGIINGPNAKQIALLRWYDAMNSNANFQTSSFGGTITATGIAFDGTDMWVCSRDSMTFTTGILDTFKTSTGKIVNTIDLLAAFTGDPSFPNALAYDGRRMWVACRATDKVYVLEGSTGAKATVPSDGEIAVGTAPVYLSFDGSQIWVSCYGVSEVHVINTKTFNVATLSGNNLTNPYGSAFDGSRMWVVNRHNATLGDVYNVETLAHEMSPAQGGKALDIAFDGVNMWITNIEDDQITILRASDGALVDTLTTTNGVGTKPTYLAFDGRNMWVVNEDDGTVSIFRVSDYTHVEDISIPSPQRIAFDGANMWITSDDGRVYKR